MALWIFLIVDTIVTLSVFLWATIVIIGRNPFNRTADHSLDRQIALSPLLISLGILIANIPFYVVSSYMDLYIMVAVGLVFMSIGLLLSLRVNRLRRQGSRGK